MISPHRALMHALDMDMIRTFFMISRSQSSIIHCLNPFVVSILSVSRFPIVFFLASRYFNFVSILSSSLSFRHSILQRPILLHSLFLQNVYTFIVFTLSSYPYFHRLHLFIVPIFSLSPSFHCPHTFNSMFPILSLFSSFRCPHPFIISILSSSPSFHRPNTFKASILFF
jgi:hypothetical protein